MRLHGRETECQILDRLLADALAGRSGVAVLRGEAGIGKSGLLAYASDVAQGSHVVRAAGVEASALIASVVEQAASPGREDEATPAHWAAAVLYNGLARFDEAKSAALRATWNRSKHLVCDVGAP